MTRAIMTDRALFGLSASDANPMLDRFLILPAEHALAQVVSVAPAVAAAIGAFVALWLLGRVARVVTVRLLQLVKLDDAIEDTLISRIFSSLGEGSTPSKVLGTIVYAAIVLMGAAAAAD